MYISTPHLRLTPQHGTRFNLYCSPDIKHSGAVLCFVTASVTEPWCFIHSHDEVHNHSIHHVFSVFNKVYSGNWNHYNSIDEIVIHLHSDFFTCSTCHLLNTPTPLDSVHRHGDDAFKRAVKQTVGSESQIPCQGDRLTFPSMDSSSLVVGLLAPLLHKLNIKHWHELYSIFSLSLVVQVYALHMPGSYINFILKQHHELSYRVKEKTNGGALA